MVGYGALEQNERANVGIGLRREQRELPEYPRAIGISHAGGKDVGLLIAHSLSAKRAFAQSCFAQQSRKRSAFDHSRRPDYRSCADVMRCRNTSSGGPADMPAAALARR